MIFIATSPPSSKEIIIFSLNSMSTLYLLVVLSFHPKMFSGFRVIFDHQRDHFCHRLSNLGSKGTGGGFLREHQQLF